jgi:hypothetical protein
MENYSSRFNLMVILICIALIFAIVFGFNTCTASEWNDGMCPKCEVRYELRGVYKHMKYYSCPKCGNEVERY